MALALAAAQVLTPLESIEDGIVLLEDGAIRAVGPRDEIAVPAGARVVELGDQILAPGFVDVHIHGAAGHDVMEATPEALEAIATFLLRHGTTSFVPTTLSAPPEVLLRSLEGLSGAIRAWKKNRSGSHGTTAVPPFGKLRAAHSTLLRAVSESRTVSDVERWAVASGATSKTPLAEPLGIHLEGPFLSAECRGVHPRASLQPPSLALFEQMLAAAGGSLRILTLAPELEGAAELQAAAIQSGVRVAIGHSNASYEQAMRAMDAGVAHAVHVFNAMRPFAHRDPGILGAILTDDRVLAEVIADGVHVAAPALRLLLRCKTPARIALVTDGVSATGMSPGRYLLGDMEICVAAEPGIGRLACRNSEGKLAGSVLTLDRAVQNMMRLAGVSLREAVWMATHVPAQLAGVADRKGSLCPGFDADLVILEPDGKVIEVVAHGQAEFLE